MDLLTGWASVLCTVGVLVLYEVALAVGQRRNPARLARSAHAGLREAWFVAMSAQPGSELLAVQTLRNSVMSATMIASTAVLVAPILAAILHPLAGPVAAVLVVAVLFGFDRFTSDARTDR